MAGQLYKLNPKLNEILDKVENDELEEIMHYHKFNSNQL